MIHMRKMLVSVMAMTAVATSAAPAAAAPPASAQAFADAASRMERSLRPEGPRIVRRGEETISACIDALPTLAPESARTRVTDLVTSAMIEHMVLPLAPHLEKLVAELDAIPTVDPGLRGGREAWRATVAAFADLPRNPQACAQLLAWAQAGWAPSAAPPAVSATKRLERWTGRAAAHDVKLRRAVRRLRVLGVAPKAAAAFTGDRALAPWNEAITDFATRAEDDAAVSSR